MEAVPFVHDIESYRLAKFILFDMWLLLLFNNAQRYGLLPPRSCASNSQPQCSARYLKIVLHAPYVQREEQWRSARLTANGLRIKCKVARSHLEFR